MNQIPRRPLVEQHFDAIAPRYEEWQKKNSYYYNNLRTFVRRNIPPQSRVIDIGCGIGDMLAACQPSRGVGIDLSQKMLDKAKAKHAEFDFFQSSIENFEIDEKFDYIILTDVIDHVYDIMDAFEKIYRLCHPQTKIVLTTINPWWEPILNIAERFGAKMPEGPHNFLEKRHIGKMLELMDFSVTYSGYLMLLPKKIPVISFLANTLGVRTWGLKKASSVQYMIIQPEPPHTTDLELGCSVIIPCHNEEGCIEDGIRRVPRMGKGTEIIVVNDGSTDQTADIVRRLQPEFPNLRLIDYSPNKGKGHAVQQGFDAAQEEVLMILDADLSTEPEELPRFFDPLNKAKCSFVNGSRLIYPMEGQAMRTLNHLGNKLFSLIMSFITGQDLSDTLCGTKAFYKSDYKYYRMGGDSWGDYDLLFSAARLGHKIMEIPVHYKERAAGESKMKSFRHGLHLLKACAHGLKELVLIPPDQNRT